MKKPYLAPEALVEFISIEQSILGSSGENLSVLLYESVDGNSGKCFWE